MRSARKIVVIGLMSGLVLAGCGGSDRGLMNLRRGNTPDEFAILPTKPLEMPQDVAALPPPTPGGTNRTDPNPETDIVVALGGRPGRVGAGGDPALMAQATRFGISADIRQTLAAEDQRYRQQNHGRLLERLFGTSVYYSAYRKQSLDQRAEWDRWRAAGIRTVGAPPPAP